MPKGNILERKREAMAAVASMIPTPAPIPEPRTDRELMSPGLSLQSCRAQGYGTMRDPSTPQTRLRTEGGLMPTATTANQTLGRVFTTALLLTASVEQAEAAILDGIRALDPGRLSDDTLFLEAIGAAVAPQRNGPRLSEDLSRASAILPAQLRSVPQLPVNLRHCFVLRILAGLPSEACAQLLNLEARFVEEAAGRAAQLLAGINCGAN